MIDIHKKPTKLLWVDLEMTGLDPRHDVILEVAAVITDFDFTVLATYEAIIYQPEEVLQRANEWATAQHTASGLIERVKSEGKQQQKVIDELSMLIQAQFMGEPAILAGNSIHQDRNFIKQWWPQINELLHYRMLDVSSLKVYMQGKYALEFTKNNTHRALDDIKASIAEWQYYLAWLGSDI